MAKEKHQPKGVKEKKVLSSDAEMTLYGLMIFLVALIGFLNRGIIGNFLTFIFVYLFGVFYFVSFLFAIFYGLYMLIKKKPLSIKINIQFLGFILVLLAAVIGASLSIEGLNFTNMFAKFQNQIDFATASGSFYHIDVAKIGLTGGGLIGFFLATLLNVTITSVGAVIFVAILFVIGAYLLFAAPGTRLAHYLKGLRHKKRKKNEERKIVMAASSLDNTPPQEEVMENNEVFSNSSASGGPHRRSFPLTNARNNGFNVQEKIEPSMPIFADDIDDTMEEDNSDILAPIKEDGIREKETEKPEAFVDIKPKNIFKPLSSVNAPKANVSDSPAYKRPSMDLLNEYPNESKSADNEEISTNRQDIINKTFNDFDIGASAISYKVGPSVTRFDVMANNDVSVKNIEKVIDDIAVRLGGVYARYAKVVPGKTTSGLEIPNVYVDKVSLKDVLKSIEHSDKKLLIPFGKDISGDVIYESLTKFPHLLVAGTTGSGKSVFVHSLIMSILMRHSPQEARFVMIDPKRVEFSPYKDMPHLLCPIITDALKAKVALVKLTQEMENRFAMLEQAQVSDIKRYNEEMEEQGEKKMPYIIVVIDEYADIIDVCREIENPLVRLAQKARAAGIHLVIATQRPSTKVVTGVLKANLATKVALMVSLPVDSVTVLGQGGAETLLGNGDMLVDCTTLSRGGNLLRIQGAYVDDREIKRVVAYLKENYDVEFDDNLLDLVDRSAMGPSFMGGTSEIDENYDDVKEFVMNREYVSISRIQNNFNFGYPRASKIFMMLQQDGIVEKTSEGSTNSKGAKVLIRNIETDNGDENSEDD